MAGFLDVFFDFALVAAWFVLAATVVMIIIAGMR